MLASIVLMVVVIVSYGCAPALIPIDKEDLVRLKNQPEVVAVHYESPIFVYSGSDALPCFSLLWGCPASAFFGALGVDGRRLLKERYKIEVEDPTPALKTKFLANLTLELKLSNLRPIDQALTSDGFNDIKKAYKGGMVFDFKTVAWRINDGGLIFSTHDWWYLRFHRGKYVWYLVGGRLMRTEDSKILWQGVCEFKTPDIERDTLIENDGALLKTKLQEAADTCAADLWGQFQGKSPRQN